MLGDRFGARMEGKAWVTEQRCFKELKSLHLGVTLAKALVHGAGRGGVGGECSRQNPVVL